MRSQMSEVSQQSVPMLFSCACAVAVAVFIGAACWHWHDGIAALLAVTAGLLGWIVGILASPDNSAQEEQFGGLAKVISGFITGYLVSKIDPLVATLLVGPPNGHPAITEPQVAKEVLIALASFFDALVIAFAGRIYWKSKKA